MITPHDLHIIGLTGILIGITASYLIHTLHQAITTHRHRNRRRKTWHIHQRHHHH